VVLLGAADVVGAVIAERQLCRSGAWRTALDASGPPSRRAVLDAVVQADRLRQYERNC
jgi:hypothetical protein